MILKIVEWPDARLLTPCDPWDFSDSEKTEQLAVNLIETMKANGGVGLAANQVGVNRTVFAMHNKAADLDMVLFNPIVMTRSGEAAVETEGCLSFPNVFLEIMRPLEVKILCQDHLKNQFTFNLTGIDARCALHEIDHLNGKVFKDYVSRLKFDMARKKGKKQWHNEF